MIIIAIVIALLGGVAGWFIHKSTLPEIIDNGPVVSTSTAEPDSVNVIAHTYTDDGVRDKIVKALERKIKSMESKIFYTTAELIKAKNELAGKDSTKGEIYVGGIDINDISLENPDTSMGMKFETKLKFTPKALGDPYAHLNILIEGSSIPDHVTPVLSIDYPQYLQDRIEKIKEETGDRLWEGIAYGVVTGIAVAGIYSIFR